MNDRERFHAVMNFEKPDRLPLWEFMGYWPETEDRWAEEGLPKGTDYRAHFGYDRVEAVGIDFNPVPAFEIEVLEEDEETRVVRDEVGVTKKEFKYGSKMPHYIDFPLKTRDDFHAFAERLDPTSPERYGADWDARVEQYKRRDYPIYLICRGLVAFERDFMDFNQLMMTFLTDRDWIEEMMDFHTDFIMRLWERALRDLDVDFVLLGEDMAFKNGPMISPELAKELLVPRYRKLSAFFRDHGVRHFIVDSDGDIRSLIPLFLESGVTGVLPLEANAFCHPVELRAQFPRLQMIGGLNKQIVALGGEAMEREVREKVEPLVNSGGYIPGFDHSVHPETSLKVYEAYLDLLREVGGAG